MAMSSSAKIKLGLLGVALVGLAIDRGLVFSGGSEASADAGIATDPDAIAASQAKAQSGEAAAPIATKLEELRAAVEVESPQRDAFRLPELLAPAEAAMPVEMLASMEGGQDQPAATPGPLAMPKFEVSSIITNSAGSKLAVINGVPIRLGQTRDGVTLVGVDARTATIRYSDRTVQVRLSE